MSVTILNYKKDSIPQVSSMGSPRSGQPVANQYVIRIGNKEIFQSYQTIIAIKDYSTVPAKVLLDEKDWNYSVTTSRYRNQFLKENTEETRKKIKSGEYALAELN